MTPPICWGILDCGDTVETHPHPDPAPVHLPFVEALLRVYDGEPIPHVDGREGMKTNQIVAQALGHQNAWLGHQNA
jgi:hypothetical protein